MSCTFEDAFMPDTENQQETNLLDFMTSLFSHTTTPEEHMEEIKSLLKDHPEVNTARVLYLKAQIEAGKYEINSDAIAAKLF